MPPKRPAALLVASLGNPPPYQSTRHSAAHVVLQQLRSSLDLPSFMLKPESYGGGGHVSVGADVGRPEITLYQSGTSMNISGPPLLVAWRKFMIAQDAAGRTPALAVLHDEMDIEPAHIKVRRGQGSARGHNGLKSVQKSLEGVALLEAMGKRFIKIGIGIGRPTGGSRQTGDVTSYVLGQLTLREKEKLQQSVEELTGVLYQELARIANS